MGDYIFLIFSLLASGFSLYMWSKSHDEQYFWLLAISVFVILLLISKLFFINLFSENVRQIPSTFIYCSWVLVIGGVLLVFRKK